MNLELWQHRFEEFLQINRYSPRTIEGYRAELRPFFAFLNAHGLSQLAAVTRETLEEYRLHLFALRRSDGRALAVTTQALKLTSILAFFRFLYRERFLVMDPGRNMEYPRVPKALPPKPLTEAQVVRLLESANEETPMGLRDRAILEVLYSSALRNSEMCELKLDELDLDRSQLRVIRGKGGKHRVVPVGEPAREALEAYLRFGRPLLLKNPMETRVFLAWRGTRGLTRECLSKVVTRAAERAGLEQHVTPHLLRHCCACHMLAHRAGLRHLQELLGHASLDTTQRYTRLELADLQKVHRRCHPRERRQ